MFFPEKNPKQKFSFFMRGPRFYRLAAINFGIAFIQFLVFAPGFLSIFGILAFFIILLDVVVLAIPGLVISVALLINGFFIISEAIRTKQNVWKPILFTVMGGSMVYFTIFQYLDLHRNMASQIPYQASPVRPNR